MPITLLDGILLGITLFSAVLAMVRGFSREVLAVASWIAAAAAAYFLYPLLTPLALKYTSSDKIAMIGSAAVVFLIALIVVSYITMRIADFIIDSRIGALDRTLGFVFGAARGILLVVVAMLFFNWLVPTPKQPDGWSPQNPSRCSIRSARSWSTCCPMMPMRRSWSACAAAPESLDRMQHPPPADDKFLPGSVRRIYMKGSTPMTDNGLKPDENEADCFHDECGVFGIFGKPEAAAVVTLGLHALQHRGQEAAGIVAFDGKQFSVERHVGLIGDTFTKRSVMDRLPGDRAIGHTRYSTTGGEGLRNVQPFFAEFAGGGFAIAHNGNITNALTVQRELQQRGSIFSSTSDTETILHLIAVSEKTRIVPKFIDALSRIEGAYSLVGLSEKKMIGARDPLGIRPLCIGDLDGAYILASETCALDIIGARFVRDVSPARLWSSPTRASRAIFPSRSSRRACASSNMSISRARTRPSRTAMSTRPARRSARNWPRNARSMPT
jgi:uncharacterized membrane protein required for colicin V production